MAKTYKGGSAKERAELKKLAKKINQRITEIEKRNKDMKDLTFYQDVKALGIRKFNDFMKEPSKGSYRFRTDLQNLSEDSISRMRAILKRLEKTKTSTKSGVALIASKGYQTFIANHPQFSNMSMAEYCDMWLDIQTTGLDKYGSGTAIEIYERKPEDMSFDDWSDLNKEIYDKYSSKLARQHYTEELAKQKGYHFKSNR